MLALTREQERVIRRLAGAKGLSCPVELVAGQSPPSLEGEPGHSCFKNGGLCHHPGGAIKAGYKVYYVRSTQRVEVGKGWIIHREWRSMLGLDDAEPLGILADWLEQEEPIVLAAEMEGAEL